MVDLWDVDLDAAPEGMQVAWLPEGDRVRIQRMGTPLLRRRMAATRAAFRLILSESLPVAPGDIPIQITGHGCPYLDPTSDYGPLWFNLTHAEGRMLVAVSSESQVGIDLERADRRVEPRKLAPAVMNDEDLAWFDRQPDELRAFLRMWTAKEAALKLLGTGLQISAPLVEIDWETLTAKISVQSKHFPGSKLALKSTLDEPLWLAHLATPLPVSEIRWHRFAWANSPSSPSPSSPRH